MSRVQYQAGASRGSVPLKTGTKLWYCFQPINTYSGKKQPNNLVKLLRQ